VPATVFKKQYRGYRFFDYQRRPDGGTLPRRLDVVAEVT
jgi:hypothetical protein